MHPEDVQASYCATLVDEWARGGVAHAVVCPGSRSTPLALALHGDGRIQVHVHHDERAGAFTALGVGLSTGVPAVVVTTSGTAAAEVHAAVVEAHQASVPLIVATADRPPELADVGAAQTIDQIRLYGGAVRWSDAPGVPDLAARSTWRARAARTVVESLGAGGAGRPGPVHLNAAFREPLVGRPIHVPEGRPDGAPWVRTAQVYLAPDGDGLDRVLASARRGIVVAGAEPGVGDAGLCTVGIDGPRIAAGLGWPLLVDARVRGSLALATDAVVVGAADALLRDPDVAEALRPDVVLHLGAPVASRIVGEWITAAGAVEVRVGEHGWTDPAHTTALRIAASAAHGAGGSTAPATEAGWADRWRRVEAAAQEAIDATLADEAGPTEVGTARALLADLPTGAHLVVSSSMPIRDVEWYGRPRSGVTIHANRGANGIDGVVSTAVGVALATGAPTTCLVGDVAFLHDSTALIGLAGRPVDLTIVVVDNDGGGIFSFLPQATAPGGPTFEELFGTPHGADIPALAAAHGIAVAHVRTDRAANVAAHRRINAAVAEAARRALVD